MGPAEAIGEIEFDNHGPNAEKLRSFCKNGLLDKEEPITPDGYGEIKVGMEGILNGVPVKVRKITKKDIIMRPLNRSIRDKDGMMVSFKEKKSG